MKIGVLSDSHGNLKNLEEAAKWLVEEEKVDVLVHLLENNRNYKYFSFFSSGDSFLSHFFDKTFRRGKNKIARLKTKN